MKRYVQLSICYFSFVQNLSKLIFCFSSTSVQFLLVLLFHLHSFITDLGIMLSFACYETTVSYVLFFCLVFMSSVCCRSPGVSFCSEPAVICYCLILTGLSPALLAIICLILPCILSFGVICDCLPGAPPQKYYERLIDHRTKGFCSIINFPFDVNRKYSNLDLR